MAILNGKHSSYGELLFRPEWKLKRKRILERDNYRCQFCGETNRSVLQVHHRQYHYVQRLDSFRFPWDYPDVCLITICKKCHDKGHATYDVPVIKY